MRVNVFLKCSGNVMTDGWEEYKLTALVISHGRVNLLNIYYPIGTSISIPFRLCTSIYQLPTISDEYGSA